MSDEDERLKNLILFKFYGTDQEMEEAFPILAIIFLIILVIFLVFSLNEKHENKNKPKTQIENVEMKWNDK